MDSQTKEHLYTARWFLKSGVVIPKDTPPALAAIEAITAALGESKPVAMSVSESKPMAPAKLDIVPMFPEGGPFPMIGAGLSRGNFTRYLADTVAENLADKTRCNWPTVPKGVVIHHTGAPSLAQRPKGWQREHMVNRLGWNKGPHLFIDEDEIFLFTPLWHRGTHAVAFNSTHWGIEMLGDYDSEDPWSGRGAAVLETAAFAAAALLDMIGVTESAGIRFHRDDPSTTKSCPGRLITRPRFVDLAIAAGERLARLG